MSWKSRNFSTWVWIWPTVHLTCGYLVLCVWCDISANIKLLPVCRGYICSDATDLINDRPTTERPALANGGEYQLALALERMVISMSMLVIHRIVYFFCCPLAPIRLAFNKLPASMPWIVTHWIFYFVCCPLAQIGQLLACLGWSPRTWRFSVFVLFQSYLNISGRNVNIRQR